MTHVLSHCYRVNLNPKTPSQQGKLGCCRTDLNLKTLSQQGKLESLAQDTVTAGQT